MTSALDRMPDSWWISYGEECNCGVPGDACARLHVAVEEDEIDTFTAQKRMVAS